MNIWIACLLVVSLSVQGVRPRKHIVVGQNVTIAPSAEIGNHVRIDSHTVIKNNADVGSHVHIKDHCAIGKNVSIGRYASISSQTTIDNYSNVERHAKIGEHCSVAQRASIHKHSRIGNNNTIGMDSILGQRSKTANNVHIGEKAIIDEHADVNAKHIGIRAYVGAHSYIGKHVKIGELAVIHKDVLLWTNAAIEPTEIVIRTPTSLLFYQYGTRNVSDDEAKIAKPPGQTISPAFNKYLGELIESDMKEMRTSCSQSSNYKKQPRNLSKIISLYLIHYHGLERFNEYMNGIRGHKRLPIPVMKMLSEECHLNKKAVKNILEPGVREKLIQLITIDQDAIRQYRVEDDQFCDMFEQINKNGRNILFDRMECMPINDK